MSIHLEEFIRCKSIRQIIHAIREPASLGMCAIAGAAHIWRNAMKATRRHHQARKKCRTMQPTRQELVPVYFPTAGPGSRHHTNVTLIYCSDDEQAQILATCFSCNLILLMQLTKFSHSGFQNGNACLRIIDTVHDVICAFRMAPSAL
jgi:hypothetical protein